MPDTDLKAQDEMDDDLYDAPFDLIIGADGEPKSLDDYWSSFSPTA